MWRQTLVCVVVAHASAHSDVTNIFNKTVREELEDFSPLSSDFCFLVLNYNFKVGANIGPIRIYCHEHYSMKDKRQNVQSERYVI